MIKGKGTITFMDGAAQEHNSFIPSDRHPFDHFLVQVEL